MIAGWKISDNMYSIDVVGSNPYLDVSLAFNEKSYNGICSYIKHINLKWEDIYIQQHGKLLYTVYRNIL